MKILKSALVKNIEAFRADKLKELGKAEKEKDHYLKLLARWETDRRDCALNLIAKNSEKLYVDFGHVWQEKGMTEITVKLKITTATIPLPLRNELRHPTDVDKLLDQIKSAEEQLALLKMCPEEMIVINSKLDRDAIQPYINYQAH
jgi:hypothetical protein